MWDVFWVVAVLGAPAVLLTRHVASDVVFAVWMRTHDRVVAPRPVFVATALPEVSEPVAVSGFAGMVIDGELVEPQAR